MTWNEQSKNKNRKLIACEILSNYEKMTEIKRKLDSICDSMNSESRSRAFVEWSRVIEWEKQIRTLTSQINAFDVTTQRKYEENWIEFCSTCHQKVSIKRQRMCKEMLSWLLKAIHHCRVTKEKTFLRKEVKFTNVEYAVFAFLVKFWLLYRNDSMKTWEFWIPFKICAEFFKWERSVLEYYDIDPSKKKWTEWYKTNSETRVFIHEIKSHDEILKQFPNTIEYLSNNNF